jgi:hypothetical protein
MLSPTALPRAVRWLKPEARIVTFDPSRARAPFAILHHVVADLRVEE